MFHVMLVLFPLILFVIVGSILLFGISFMVAGVIGGATSAALIKNKTIKYLLLIFFCILLSVGSLFIFPFIGLLTNFSVGIVPIVSAIILAFIGVLSVAGIKISKTIGKKIGKIILIVAFGIIAVLAISIAIFMLILI